MQAPLGIITAIIAAVRISGPLWLRAIVGRARKNRAAAEVELTTSTSQDVCELWNGSTVVRILGSSQVLELILLDSTKNPRGRGLVTLKSGGFEEENDAATFWKMAFRFKDKPLQHANRLLIKLEFKERLEPISKFWGGILQRVSGLQHMDEEEGCGNEKEKHSNEVEGTSTDHQSESFNGPNMFLNLRPPKTLHEQWQLRGWAAFSVMLQAGVLVFSGCATYHPHMSYKKDGRRVEPYAYPLTAGGTMLVVLGVLMCSLVVEWSTVERVWKIGKDDQTARILWLQNGGNFNDQNFSSYAVFARGPRSTVLTSKLSTHGGPENTSRYREILVVLGTATSLGGFIAQFTGFRGMHWSATIAQLVATLIMVGIRAWIRRDLASLPLAYRLPKGHEMDWLATRITKPQDCDRLWEESAREEKEIQVPYLLNAHLFRCAYSTLQRLARPFTRRSRNKADVGIPSDGLLDMKCRDWEIVTGEEVDDFIFQKLQPESENSTSNGHQIMEMWKSIGSLGNWTGPTSDPAISLAKGIEVVMDTLFPTTDTGDEDEVLCWTMNCRSHDGFSNPILLSVERNEKSGFTWKASATELEAVLSLWIYSIHTENIKVGSKERKKNEQSGKEEDWLRDGNAAIRTATLRRRGEGTKPYLRDLRWYLGDKFDVIKETIEIETIEIETDKRLVDVVRPESLFNAGHG